MVNYIDFDHPDQTGHVIGAIRESIDFTHTGYCIVRNRALSPDDFMALLHGNIGESFTASLVNGRRVMYDLVKDSGEYRSHKEGSILSASNLAFPLHTDCSFLEKPADMVILYCVENSETGGESILLNINEIISLLPAGYIGLLLTKKFYVYSKAYTILEQLQDRYAIRFNLNEFLAGNPPDPDGIVADLKLLTDLLNDPSHFTTAKLNPNECLVLNNRTCLHGRYAFEDNSKRIFYRARHYRNWLS